MIVRALVCAAVSLTAECLHSRVLCVAWILAMLQTMLGKEHRSRGAIFSELRYSGSTKNVSLQVDELLEQWNPTIRAAFKSHWCAHRCDVPGCGTHMILDGHFKCRRTVCRDESTGRWCPELNINLPTGCRATPEHNSHYCAGHALQHTQVEDSEVAGQAMPNSPCSAHWLGCS